MLNLGRVEYLPDGHSLDHDFLGLL